MAKLLSFEHISFDLFTQNIDIVFYTGDFTDHFGWLTTKSSVEHSIEFVTQQIKANFPNVPVVMVIGNHDIHPSDA